MKKNSLKKINEINGLQKKSQAIDFIRLFEWINRLHLLRFMIESIYKMIKEQQIMQTVELKDIPREDLEIFIYEEHKTAYGIKGRHYDFTSMSREQLEREAESIALAKTRLLELYNQIIAKINSFIA